MEILFTSSVSSDIEFCIAGATSFNWLMSTCTSKVLLLEKQLKTQLTGYLKSLM